MSKKPLHTSEYDIVILHKARTIYRLKRVGECHLLRDERMLVGKVRGVDETARITRAFTALFNYRVAYYKY